MMSGLLLFAAFWSALYGFSWLIGRIGWKGAPEEYKWGRRAPEKDARRRNNAISSNERK